MRILSPLTVATMTQPRRRRRDGNVRGARLGHRLAPTRRNRGELLPIGSFGHTGFTGTSLWIDPATRMFVIFLSNRVHPDGKGDVDAAARARRDDRRRRRSPTCQLPAGRRGWTGRDFGAVGIVRAPAAAAAVLTGIDVLRAERFARLRGKRVGLVTNHTGRARDGATDDRSAARARRT